MKRREFITLAGAAAAVWSSRAQAQQRAMPTIGWLNLGSEPPERFAVEAFRSSLADLGYTEGKNIRVLYRFADGNADRLSALAGELVSLGATIIVTASSAAVRAAHDAAPNVPIVTWAGPSPLLMGWAQTLARPGGMITGVFDAQQHVKKFELLKEVRPQATTFGFLLMAIHPSVPLTRKSVDYVARTLGISVEIIEVKDQSELADAFHRMKSLGVAGLALTSDPVFSSNARMLVELARTHKLPTVFEGGDFVSAGGLFDFTNDYVYMARRSASYVDQILKGAAPGDLAAEEGKVYKLLVNVRTAKELGITIPPSVLARADEVIE
jgi:putative tryptophan/tyrosine transport system substrate-binding protein